MQGGGELELPIVRLKSVGFGYKSQPELFSGVDMCIDGKSRICLLGENGAGKTTLVKVSRLPRLFFVRFSRARQCYRQCVGAKCAWGAKPDGHAPLPEGRNHPRDAQDD